jgi:pyruvate,water dikinase
MNTKEATTRLSHGRQVTVNAGDQSVYDGVVHKMLESPCASVDLTADSPFMRKLRYILKFVSTLDLVDPLNPAFNPRNCRSLHDIIRYSHEKAVQEMFHISDNRLRKLGFAKKLETKIPMQFHVLDVGGGLREGAESLKQISIQDVHNQAMRTLWTGLTHPDIQWGALQHFDWEAHDRIVMSGGIASPKATMFASHAVISEDYMNLNLKFGYHFVIVDALCREDDADNLIQFRFSGGGTAMHQRMLRAMFLKKILERLNFAVEVKSDLVDGQFKGSDLNTCLKVLEMIGRLLGATPLMDMHLKNESMVESYVDDFMQGRYRFGSV